MGDSCCSLDGVVLEQLGGVEEAGLQARVEDASLERLHERGIGVSAATVTVGQRAEPGQSPLTRVVVQQPDLRVRGQPDDPVTELAELFTDRGDVAVGAAWLLAVWQDTSPVGFGTEVQGVPVPVLDHLGAAADQCPHALPALPRVGGVVHRGQPDRSGADLGDEERFVAGAEHPIRRVVQPPGALGPPGLREDLGTRQRESVLRFEIRVPGGDREQLTDRVVSEGGPTVGHAGGHEPVAGVLVDNRRLPRHELRQQVGLEGLPGEGVLRQRVRVGPPQIAPIRKPVRPVGQSPFPVQDVDGAVAVAQGVAESFEDPVIMQHPRAGFVIDLESDDRRVGGVAREDGTNDPFSVETERGVRDVDLLPQPPAERFPGRDVDVDLRVSALQPRRDRVGGGAEDHPDAVFLGHLQNRHDPLQVKDAVFWLPGRPHRLADADDGEPRGFHLVEVLAEPLGGLVLVVVGRTEKDLGEFVGHRLPGCDRVVLGWWGGVSGLFG